MDVLARYSITGYSFLAVLYVFSPTAKRLFESNMEGDTAAFLVLGIVMGIPLGYVLNQISSFLFHVAPGIGIHRKSTSDRFVTDEAKKEMEVYRAQLKAFDKSFDFRAWYVWRWTHLTVNVNLMVSIVLGVLFSSVINGVNEKWWLPDYSLQTGMAVVITCIFIITGVLYYNTYLLRWFITSMNATIMDGQQQNDTDRHRDSHKEPQKGTGATATNAPEDND